MNQFSEQLKVVVQLSGVKYAAIADAVQYDISYVSKWISGKMLPTKKSISRVVFTILETIEEFGDSENLKNLCYQYDCEDVETLKKVLYDILLKAYYEATGFIIKKDSRQYYPELSHKKFADNLVQHFWDALENEKSVDFIGLLDLYQMNHGARLLFAGIRDGHFAVPLNQGASIKLIVNLSGIQKKDALYTTIILIHMMTAYSGTKFQIFQSEEAESKCIYALKGKRAASGIMLSGDENFVSFVETEERDEVEILHHKLRQMTARKEPIFSEISTENLVPSKVYTQSLIATNVKWVLGHVTEHLLPGDLFEEIFTRLNETSDIDESILKMHVLTESVLEQPNTRIVIYDSALSNLALTGEIDYFNHKVILNEEERMRVFSYLRERIDFIQIRRIDSYLDEDFHYISNPCIFLSDAICYMRLENGRYEDNLFVIKNREVRDIANLFFEQLWNERRDVLISDKDDFKKVLLHYENQQQMLGKFEKMQNS